MKRRKGLTLVEIILSLAIAGLIAVSFLSIMSGSIKMIKSAGSKSQALYQAQSKIDEQISEIKDGNSNINVTINGVPASIEGTFVTQTVTVGGQTVTIKIFAPEF